MAWKASDFSDTTGWKPEDFSDEYGNKPASKVKPNKNALPYKAALKPKETAKSVNPFPHRSDITNNQPAPKVDSLSYLKPIEQTKKGNAIDLNLPAPKKTGYVVGGLPVGDGKGNVTFDKRPVTVIKQNGKTTTVETQDGLTKDIDSSFVRYEPIGNEQEELKFASNQSQQNLQNYQKEQYASMNPVERFVQKSTDIGFRGDESTPSLGNPVADVSANIIGTLLSLATPTGGGNNLGGAMNAAGDIVEAGIQKNAGNVINKLPKVAQKLLPRATREVGEGLVYSASKAPEYTTKDWVENALQDATIGTALGSFVDGAKKLPEAIDTDQKGLFPSSNVNTPPKNIKPVEAIQNVKPNEIKTSPSIENVKNNSQPIQKTVGNVEDAVPKRMETLNNTTSKTIDEPIETTITKLERSKGMLEFNNKMMTGADNKLKTQGFINEINAKIDNLKAKQKLIPEDIDGLKTFIKGMEEQQSKGIGIDLQLFASAKEKLKKLERGFSKNIRTDNYIDDSLRKSFEENPLTYDPLSNKETLSKAEAIYNKGYDVALDEWNRNLGNFRPEDVPLSKMLANKAIENGDMDTARRIISDAANKLTQAGQYSQAARILRQADPGATNIFIQSELDKLNKDGLKQYGKKWEDIQLTDDELKAIDSMQGKPEADREAIMEEIFNNISRRLPVTKMEKFDAWRRMAMLLNPKTHIRNIEGNILMKGLRVSSDKIGAVLEKAVKVPEGQRTKALRWKNNKELVDIVNSNWKINKKELLQEGRFDINSLRFLNRDKPIFKTKWLEAVNQFSKDTLNLEDSVFFKDAYKDSLGQYLKSNNLKQVTKQAQEYATDKAMEATFKRTNQLATWINQAKSKKGIGKVVDAAVPFVKTPANILQTSVDYSPAGFLKLLYDRKSPAQVIETISKGLTGTALVGVGFGLASMGWMRLNRKNSSKAEEILGQVGEQPNSIVTPLGSYTFDWAQPFSVPLAMGTAIFESIEQDEDIASTVIDAVAAGGDTFFNMSMLQNIKGLMGGKYDSTTEGLMELPVSYLEQGFPTLFGQVARSIDPVRRNTYDSNPVKSFGKKVMAKTPGVSKLLPPKLDQFGQEQKQASALEQFFSPGYSKGKTDNPAIKEVARLYKDTKDTSFLPRIAPLNFSEKKIKYNLNSDQITKFQREMGQNNLSDIERLISSPSYQNASDEDKKKMIKKITDNNYERTKRNYLKENTGK